MTHYEEALQSLNTAEGVAMEYALYHVGRAVVFALLDVSTALTKIAGKHGIVYTRNADQV